jgi:hypothetical protein
LEAGQTIAATHLIDALVMKGPAPGADLRSREFDEDGWTLYVMGQIRYRTPGSNVTRFMGFCRARTSEGRFQSVGDPEYEYEDYSAGPVSATVAGGIRPIAQTRALPLPEESGRQASKCWPLPVDSN